MSWNIFVSCRPVAANGFERLKPLINYRFSAVPRKDGDKSKSFGCHPWWLGELGAKAERPWHVAWRSFLHCKSCSCLPHLEINMIVLKEEKRTLCAWEGCHFSVKTQPSDVWAHLSESPVQYVVVHLCSWQLAVMPVFVIPVAQSGTRMHWDYTWTLGFAGKMGSSTICSWLALM